MSILPSQAQESSSRSTSFSQIPNSPEHGTLSLSPSSSLSQLASLQISESGPLAPTAEYPGGSNEKVTDIETPNGGEKVLPHNTTNTRSQCCTGGKGVGSTQARVKMSGHMGSPRNRQSNSHIGGRKGQMMNGNHLLNFYYDPISRSQPRAPPPPPPKRHQKRKAYNKDLFLQANYKFVLLDTGNYSSELMDPDKMLQWDDIICLRYSTPCPVQCPICLDYPLCPQITSCGHIFCFPCILRYLLGEDYKSESFRRCPLCFVMISPKDLYTISIENVKQYHLGDTIEFVLLTRQKDSFNLFPKYNEEKDAVPYGSEIHDRFAKFIFTSDVDLSVRKAISELDGWLARADSGLVDDIEKLPYVCAAMEQLEQRRKYWNKHRACEISGSSENSDCQAGLQELPSTSQQQKRPPFSVSGENKHLGSLTMNNEEGRACLNVAGDVGELGVQELKISSSYEKGKSLHAKPNGFGDVKEKESYNFYQAADGQHLILHPLNMKCLLHHFGSYDTLPDRITGKILQLETVTQTEATRRRYRYLSHFSLTTTFQLCEIDLSEMLPLDALSPFMDEIKKREKMRKQLAKKERKEKGRAEASTTFLVPSYSSCGKDSEPAFSMDDFKALGTPVAMSSSSPVVGERKLFSSVTKLGFAAGYDSPALKIEETNSPPSSGTTSNSSAVTPGVRNAGAMSFANVTSRERTVENVGALRMNESGKKGKKQGRVLLSTAGGRRY